MTETKSDPRTEPLTDAQLGNLEQAARASFGEDERSQGLINGVLSLITEVRRLRHDDAVWDKHSLVQIVTARDEWREEVKRLQSLLETEQHAKWAAEQGKQHLAESLESATE